MNVANERKLIENISGFFMKQLLTLTFILVAFCVQAQNFPIGPPKAPNADGTVNLGRKADGLWYERNKNGQETPFRIDPRANTLPVYRTMADVQAWTVAADNAPSVINVSDPGRGGIFVRNVNDAKTPDDGVMVLRTKSGVVYERIVESFINVKWFGAKGDGEADDHAALQKALNYCKNKGITLFLSDGVYNTSQPLSVTINNSTGHMFAGGRRLNILGTGRSNVAIRYTGSADITVLKVVGTADDNLNLEGFRIISANTNVRKATGLDIRNLSNFTLKEVNVSFFDKGVNLIDAGEGIVEKCVFDWNDKGFYAAPAGYGIAPNGIVFLSCAFNSNREYGCLIENGCNNSFIGCRLLSNGEGPTGRAIKLQYIGFNGGVSGIIQGCYAENNRGATIEIVAAAPGAHVLQGNTFNRLGTKGSSHVDILFTPLNLVHNDGKVNVISMQGNSFMGYSGYPPSSANPRVICAPGPNNYNNWLVDDNNFYQFDEEKPVYGANVRFKNEPYDTWAHSPSARVAINNGTLNLANAGSYYVYINNTAGTITDIEGIPPGKQVILQADHPIVIQHNAKCILRNATNFTFTPGQTITLYRQNPVVWREVARQ
ncbi:hypothetical protein IC229_21425 [Spirosoma sp. BT702]|uniref:Right handed beta helix domain-containing protein n=1 Tax=Spirosoma profusum TaxID=2771354 RepID=A0A926Y4G8_9BACT|nr:right-handed parallel beta-helix repeat-containing protein [Spirosoma profusum]MBD2703220.1 hypothetical protein [Spirosoma profusum]